MGVEAFGFDEVLRKLGQQDDKELSPDTRILRELTFIAEEACNKARDTYPTRNSGGYDDHTRNLRGSIGYKILFNGTEVINGGFDGRGSSDGENAAQTALGKFNSSDSLWEIVIVAGMEYARYVEAKGHNVVSFVQAFLDEQIKQLIQNIKNNGL